LFVDAGAFLFNFRFPRSCYLFFYLAFSFFLFGLKMFFIWLSLFFWFKDTSIRIKVGCCSYNLYRHKNIIEIIEVSKD
jgi:hypothetical protein